MKRLLNITIALAFTIIFCISCGTKVTTNTPPGSTGDVNPGNPQVEEEYTFEAEILETDGGLLIKPDAETNELKSSDKISVHTKDTKFYDKDGNEIALDDLQIGNRISIVYNGVIMESYPAQISAISITLLENNDLLEAYKAVIDDIYKEDEGLNTDISIIALDLTEVTNLTEEEQNKLVKAVKESYEIEVLKATYEELEKEGLIDKENLYFETGILIKIKKPNYDIDKKVLTYGIEKWRSGLGAIGSDDATASLKNDEWKVTKENMWIS